MKLEPRKGRFSREQPTPVDRIMADLPGVYYRLSEVGLMLNVSNTTLRRLLKKEEITAPSKIVTRGGLRMYLYTPEDVEELRKYFGKGHGQT